MSPVCRNLKGIRTIDIIDCSCLLLYFLAGASPPHSIQTDNIVSIDSPVAVTLENEQDDEITGQDDFILELFGEQAQTSAVVAWLPISLSIAKTEVSSGLKDVSRNNLLMN